MKQVFTVPIDVELTIEEYGKGSFHAWRLGGFHVRGRDKKEILDNAQRAIKPHLERMIGSKQDSYVDAMNYLNKMVGNYNNFVGLIDRAIVDVIRNHGPITEDKSIRGYQKCLGLRL